MPYRETSPPENACTPEDKERVGSSDALKFDEDRLNVNSGAIATGHPFGATGARITGTLTNNLRSQDKTIGRETMSVGGGQGVAMVIERSHDSDEHRRAARLHSRGRGRSACA